MSIENNENTFKDYYGYDKVLLAYGSRTDDEIEKIITQGLKDYNKGTPFPLDERFNGLDNYRIICELDNSVVAVRKPDLTYASWVGDTVRGVNFGHYMMSREAAMEDFALRAKLIDTNMLDADTFHAHIAEIFDENDWYPNGDMVNFRVTSYKYGNGKNTATDAQIDFINTHLDVVTLFSQCTEHTDHIVTGHELYNSESSGRK